MIALKPSQMKTSKMKILFLFGIVVTVAILIFQFPTSIIVKPLPLPTLKLEGGQRARDNRLPETEQFPDNSSLVDQIFSNVSGGCHSLVNYFTFSNATNTEKEATMEYINKSLALAPFLKKEHELITYQESKFFRVEKHDEPASDLHEASLGGVALFRNVFVHGKHPVIFDCNVAYWAGGCIPEVNKEEISSSNYFSTSVMNQKVRRFDTGVLLAQFWGMNFYHQLIEDLPRLAMVHKYVLNQSSTTKIAIFGASPQVKFLYRMLGIPESRLAVFGPSDVLFFKRLLVPSATPCGRGRHGALQYVQKLLGERIPVQFANELKEFRNRTNSRRVIVLQKRAHSRALLNHDELLNRLRNAFSSCCTVLEFSGNESLADVFLLHHSADLIIGPHGAGLSWAIVARPGTPMIEIAPQKGNFHGKPNLCHQGTARAIGSPSKLILSDHGTAESKFTASIPEVLKAAARFLKVSVLQRG